MALYCKEPFYNIEIDKRGDVYLCCQTWHPVTIGNILENTLEEVWLSDKAKSVRSTIIDQSYKHCRLDICPAWISKTIPSDELINEEYPGWWEGTVSRVQFRLPNLIKFSFDASCNLQCPSCRVNRIQFNESDKEYATASAILNRIKDAYLSAPNKSSFHFTITGSGDAIGSHLFRNFLLELDGSKFPNMKINILTNGVMLTEKVIRQLHRIHKNIKLITISVDAATEDTYNKVRKGGDFNQLKKNIDYINKCKELQHANLLYTYVVQNSNFREMKQFAEWITSYPRAKVRFTRILDWGHGGYFSNENIWDNRHQNHEEFFKVLNEPWTKHERLLWTNISPDKDFNQSSNKILIPVRYSA